MSHRYGVACVAVAVLTFGVVQLHAAPRPIREARSAEEMVDSFDDEAPAYKHWTRGAIAPKLTTRAGYARHGTQSLLLEIPPTGADGRNSVLLEWNLKDADWTAWDGLSFWFQAQDDRSPGFTADLSEADGAHYWRKASPLPRQAGEWQLVKLPFKAWSWSWEGPEDANQHFDRDGLTRLKIEIRGDKTTPVVFALDGLGLYHVDPPYAGPKVTIDADKGGWRRAPGSDYQLRLTVADLPPGKDAEVEVRGTDYWGAASGSTRW